jgi:hypothetical protein
MTNNVVVAILGVAIHVVFLLPFAGAATCGDGVVEFPEECDTGTLTQTLGAQCDNEQRCNDNCEWESCACSFERSSKMFKKTSNARPVRMLNIFIT